MSTPIANFIEPIRFLVGDHDDANREYEDPIYTRGVKSAVLMGLVPGYSLASDNSQITPDVTLTKDFALFVAKVAFWLVGSKPSREGIRTRGWSEQVGDYKELLMNLERLVYEMENGDMCGAWQSYMGFLEGYSGIRDGWAWMSRLTLEAPWSNVTLGQSGAVIN